MAFTTSSSAGQSTGALSARSAQRIAIWLFVMCGLVAAMVIVGGATRLTDSGLSITEWRPVTGAVPPLTQEHWLDEFEKYKTIPEYEQVNFGMSLDEFKTIYWWEWAHRFLGRLIGVAFMAPLIFFAATGQMTKIWALKLSGLFVLGGVQGALGWWMVSSGLADRVDVSQYRLAAHLGLAVLLFGLMFWFALDLLPGRKRHSVSTGLRYGAYALSAGVFAQIILGAFVAGLRAGRTYNTWPLMDGKFFPEGYFAGAPQFHHLFETMAAVQFNHRIGAYLLAGGIVWFYLAARKTALEMRARLVICAAALQIALGVWTVLEATPLVLGLVHQAGALVLFSAALFAAHGAGNSAAHSG
ncbi:COX15/CtaA family protein [Hyphococcus sp.]|uniref:COX15/CtaA family protein n=1 Tax=Hyphococcus sp. TaxID=2038636 RepID=UPI003CCBD795